MTKISTVEGILRENTRCEHGFLEVMGLPKDSPITTEVFEPLTSDKIMKANASMLSAFINICIKANLFERCIISTAKGNPVKVRKRDIDKEQKVHYCYITCTLLEYNPHWYIIYYTIIITS